MSEHYFLSELNSAATTDQQALEALAMEVAATPVVLRARDQARNRWLAAIGYELGADRGVSGGVRV